MMSMSLNDNVLDEVPADEPETKPVERRPKTPLEAAREADPVVNYTQEKTTNGPCPKCAFDEPQRVRIYCPGLQRVWGDRVGPCREETEHLHWYCASCRYQWITDPISS